jgi:hypothetical protein
MKSIKTLALAMGMTLILFGCVLETGNPNLAGSWSCHETSQIFLKGSKGTSIYQVTFERDAVDQDQYRIDNFYKLGNGIQVSVLKDGYSLILPKQSVDGFVFEGAGTMNETYDLINMTYTADDGGGVVDHVTAEYSR